MMFENKVLRKVFEQMDEIGGYRRRKSTEIRGICKEADVVVMMKNRRIQWMGFVC